MYLMLQVPVFSKKDLELYPEQLETCKEMGQIAGDVQQWRRTNPESKLIDYKYTLQDQDPAFMLKQIMAYKVFEVPETLTPSEVGFDFISHCVKVYQEINANSLES